MTLIAILLATLCAGIGSVWLAAALSFGVLARYTQHMLSLAAGALLATAFLNLLPEAFESQAGAKELLLTLLIGLVFFFLLDKNPLSFGDTEFVVTNLCHRSPESDGPVELEAKIPSGLIPGGHVFVEV